MAIAVASVFEVRTTGSDTACSGGFVTGASGTDYSQQNAAQYSLSGLTSSGAGNVILTASASADMVGNLLLVTAGTNFTLNTVFQVTSVSVGVSITVSTNNAGTAVTTGAGAAGAAVIGGCNASPGYVAGQLIATNFVHIKAGTYIVTTTSSNVAAGIVADAKGATWIGYQTTRLDYGTQPLIQAASAGVTGVTLFSITNGGGNNSVYIANIGVDGQSKASITGYSNTRTYSGYRLYAINCTVIGLSIGAGAYLSCYATTCSGTAGISSTGALIGCQSYSNTTVGFVVGSAGGSAGYATLCIAYSNSGASSDGFQTGIGAFHIVSCTSYGNGRAGFRFTGLGIFTSCVAEGNTGKGFDSNSGAVPSNFLINCAGFNNSVNVDVAFTGLKVGFVTYSSTAFVAAGSGNFALNNTVGGGASLRAAGFPGTMPTGLSVGFQDIGAVQHADPAGGTTIYPIFD